MLSSEIKRKINTNEYRQSLDEYFQKIVKQLKDSNSESTVGGIFENNIYSFIDYFFNEQIIFIKEATESYFRHAFKGRTDAISNNLIIEYKDKGKLDTKRDQDSAISQIKDYMMQIYKNSGSKYEGIVTNGEKVSYVYFFDETIKNTRFSSFNIRDLDRIVQSLLNIGTKQYNPKNIVRDFNLESSTGLTSNLLMALYDTYENNKTQKTQMLFEEWQVLFRLSDSDHGQNQDIVKRKESLSKIFDAVVETNYQQYSGLFLLQTAYAIIVKLIACNVLSKLTYDEEIEYFSDLAKVTSPKLQRFVEKMEDGYIFSTGGIRNLLEGDFFSWYSDEYQWSNELYLAIMEIIKELDLYSTSATNDYEFLASDIFKDLYMEIMPNEVRHSLGEYFTPTWLADQVVKNAIKKLPKEKKNKWIAIDPTCGSGVFVITLIKEILSEYNLHDLTIQDKQYLLHEILDRVHGIDINPVSVLTARVSYLLAILPLIEDQKFEIPIYLGDSADIPKEEKIDNIPCYIYTIETVKGDIDVVFPTSYVKSKGFFEKMYLLQSTIKAEDSKLLYNQIIGAINPEHINEKVKSLIKQMCEKLVELHENEWDGIWIRIASNFMLIARISETDIICGNPPWVKWEYLPTNYANKLKNNIDKRLFSGQSYMGAIALNLCALIANTTSSAWLSEKGVLAFLMPETILTQDSFEGFRNFYLEDSNTRLYLKELDDWTEAGSPFVVTSEKFMTYFYTFEEINYSEGLPVNYYKKQRRQSIARINKFHTFDSVEKYFEVSKGIVAQIDDNRTGFTKVRSSDYSDFSKLKSIIGQNDYKARSGVEFTPAEVYFITPWKKSTNKGCYKFKVSDNTHSVYKSSFLEGFEIETKYVRPVIKGPSIGSFEILEHDNYCIFPYEFGNREAIELENLINTAPLTAQYFLDQKKLIEAQSKRSREIAMGKDFYSLSKVGDYTFQKYKVAFRDNTNMIASVISDIKTPWGDLVSPVCAKHAPYISMDKDKNPISYEEAYYIAGIINTDIVNKYIKTTFSGRSYSINFNIHIPKFSKEDVIQDSISKLAIEASNTEDLDKKEKLREEIQNLYLKLCVQK